MKCICGYERLQHWSLEEDEIKGDEEFIKITCFGKEFETNIKKNNWSNDCETAYLYACPKCGTVKMDI